MNKTVLGIIAHVDAGKTTLAESLLYKAGTIRKTGRVDNGDTALDTHDLEKERGITIFAGQSVFCAGENEITLLDTPGHVDFSAETERILKVLDYAVLVISGTDGVQSHTRTLWKLLRAYTIPTFIFVTKMDYARLTKSEILADLKELCGESVVDFSSDCVEERDENIAVCDEKMLEKYLETGFLEKNDISELIARCVTVPCYFGSGLKDIGVDEFLNGLCEYIQPKNYGDDFSAKVYKITHDSNGERLTHLKITGGSLKIKEVLDCNGKKEKVNGIRVYYGQKYVAVENVDAGGVCAVTGITSLNCGDGLGVETSFSKSFLEPVMDYRIVLPENCDVQTFLPKLRLLEAEDPQLHISWDSFLQEIHISLMGDIQTEILKSIISRRFDVDVEIDSGKVMYKETVENTVEGVGHYEPLRHYAEVHLIIEPLPRGSGIVLKSDCGENLLDKNYQNLVLMHLSEKEHLGVLTGSPITDVKITLVAGRAHLKHTEGGDFRQATYRALRQGLMQANSRLLEPYYEFRLEVPPEQIGRAINDIRMKHGTFEQHGDSNGLCVIVGKAPVVCLNSYMSEVAAYTGGKGRLFLNVCGYDVCHNEEEIIESFRYSPESDTENSPDSVFCAHGAGFNVKWDKVFEYMHIEPCLKHGKPSADVSVNKRNFRIDDKELEAIMEREFGKDKHPFYRYSHKTQPSKPRKGEYNPTVSKKYTIVDGYNVIFAWESLKDLANFSLESARQKLMDILCNYSAFTKNEVVLVFDAYKVPGNKGKRFVYNNIRVVYTKERETGDNYIEKMISEIGKNENVRVVTSDSLIQLSAVRFGVLRVSAREFEHEVEKVDRIIDDVLLKINKPRPQRVGELIEILSDY